MVIKHVLLNFIIISSLSFAYSSVELQVESTVQNITKETPKNFENNGEFSNEYYYSDESFFDEQELELDFNLEDLEAAEPRPTKNMSFSEKIALAQIYLNACSQAGVDHVFRNRNAYIGCIILCSALGISYLIAKQYTTSNSATIHATTK